jgi:hypothetical protein
VPFPDLTLRTDTRRPEGVAQTWAEAQGVPDNGVNTIALPFLAAGIPEEQLDEDWLEIDVVPLNEPSSVTAVSYVVGSLATLGKAAIQLNFTQTGGDAVLVRVRVIHTLVS